MDKAPFISNQIESGEYYFLNLAPSRNSAGEVVCGGKETCASDYHIHRKRFLYYGLEYVVSGEGLLTINRKSFGLHPGALFMYSPSTPHTIVSRGGDRLVKHFIDFVGPRFTVPLKEHPLSAGAPVYFPSNANMVYLFDNLLRNGRASLPNTPAICACLLELLLLQSANTALNLSDVESASHLRFQNIRKLIAEKFLALNSLEEVAALTHTDCSYICRIFKRYSNESPYDMLIRMKMQYAADLLNGSSSLVKEVARTVGFSDPYHFSRVFRSYYGYSPRGFLARIRHARLYG